MGLIWLTLFLISDEVPTAKPLVTCGPDQATCANSDCVLKTKVCNGNYDCSDGSDERNCSEYFFKNRTFFLEVFKMDNNCISGGGSDCEPNEFQCDNKRCILKTWRCDSDDDCGDGSDETFCATNPPGSQCKYYEWMCTSGDQCIPKSFHCDGEMDCQDTTDEIGCSKSAMFSLQVFRRARKLLCLYFSTSNHHYQSTTYSHH